MTRYQISYGKKPKIVNSLKKESLDLAPVIFARRGINSTANSPSPLKWTVNLISVHFNGLSLLARELILWRLWTMVQDLSTTNCAIASPTPQRQKLGLRLFPNLGKWER